MDRLDRLDRVMSRAKEGAAVFQQLSFALSDLDELTNDISVVERSLRAPFDDHCINLRRISRVSQKSLFVSKVFMWGINPLSSL